VLDVNVWIQVLVYKSCTYFYIRYSCQSFRIYKVSLTRIGYILVAYGMLR